MNDIEKILTEAAREANELGARPAERFVEGIRAQTTWARGESDLHVRQRLLTAVACAVRAIAEMDAEADSAKYLEQARALLVAAHEAGLRWLRGDDAAVISMAFELQDDTWCASIDAEPDEIIVERLARVLRERAR